MNAPNPATDAPLLLIGAAVRALAASTRRAGIPAVAADLFADRDLRNLCPAVQVDGSTESFRKAAVDAPDGPVMYTGGLENAPDLIDEVSRNRPVWGVDAAALRQIRDPFHLYQTMIDCGLPALSVMPLQQAGGATRGSRWMLKPCAGAGGLNVRVWSGRREDLPADGCGWYLQEFAEGTSVSAAYLGNGSSAELIGLTRQFVSGKAIHPGRFQYGGSVGPIVMSRRTMQLATRMGEAIASAFCLRGLFGIDLILNRRGLWATEVNPRYTASMEIHDQVAAVPLVRRHGMQFSELVGNVPGRIPAPKRTFGKQILYAPFSCVAPEFPEAWCQASRDLWRLPADVPCAGISIPAGAPVCTVRADGHSVRSCLRLMRRRATRISQMLVPNE